MGFAYLCELAIGEVFEQGGFAHRAISDQDVSKLVVENWLDHRAASAAGSTPERGALTSYLCRR